MNKRICLISSGHLSSNPRLVKEASSLSAAGYQVCVISADYFAPLRESDAKIKALARWETQACTLPTGLQYLLTRILQELCRYAASSGLMSRSSAVFSESLLSSGLARLAAEHPADLYIAHTLAALPAAALAARKNSAKYAFDAEDYHLGELTDSSPPGFMSYRSKIEREFIPGCAYLSAASPLIAERYRLEYGRSVETILNVFPLIEAPDEPLSGSRSLYWFSQTVGAGRGIEQVIMALAEMNNPPELHLRGIVSEQYRKELIRICSERGLERNLFFHQTENPELMAKLAAPYAAGLSLESSYPEHHDLALGNKIFTYLLAGLPVFLSKTRAQQDFFKQIAGAAFLIDLEDPVSFARVLEGFFDDSQKLAQLRQEAWRLAQTRYNWDFEQQKFLKLVAGAFHGN